MATINETTGISGSPTSRSSAINIYKDDYIPMLETWLHAPGQVVPNRVAIKRGKMGGRATITMVPTGRPTGVGSRMEGWKLPTHRGSTQARPEIIARGFKLRTRITFEAQLSSVSKGNAGAWISVRALEDELVRDQLLYQWVGNLVRGNFDVLGVVKTGAGSAVADATVTLVLEGANARRSTAGLFFAVGAQEFPLSVNMPFSLVRAASGASGSPANTQSLGTAGEAYITAIDTSDPDNPQITVAPPSGVALNTVFGGAVAAGDFIVPYASRRDSVNATAATAISDYAGMNGIPQFTTDATIYAASMGLAKSAVPALSGNFLHASGTQRDFSKRLLGLGIRRTWSRSGKTPNRGLLEPSTLDEIFKEDMGLQRYGEVQGEKGMGDLKIRMHGVVVGFDVDFMALPGRIEMLNDSFFGYFEACPLQSPDDFSNRFVPDYDQLETVAVKVGNVMCTRPFSLASLDDLTYSVSSVT